MIPLRETGKIWERSREWRWSSVTLSRRGAVTQKSSQKVLKNKACITYSFAWLRRPMLHVVIMSSYVQVDIVLLQNGKNSVPRRLPAVVMSSRKGRVVSKDNLPVSGRVGFLQLSLQRVQYLLVVVFLLVYRHSVNRYERDIRCLSRIFFKK